MKNIVRSSNDQEPLNAPSLDGLFSWNPLDFQEVKRPLRTKSGKRPIKVGKRPIKEGKRPIKAMVLVGISVGCLMGCFRAPPPWRKTAPLKRPIKRSMIITELILAHQNRTIAIASDFRVDGAKSPEIPQKEGVLGSEIAARNRKSLATFHRTLKSQCSIAFSCLGNRCDFWGPRWASQSQIAKIAAISVR